MYSPLIDPVRAPRRRARALAALVALVSIVLGGLALTMAPADALCRTSPCIGDRDPGPLQPAPTPPVVTAITGVSPGFGWTGDTVKLTGTGFTGAQVTFNGQTVALASAGSTSLTFVVPPTTLPFGPPIVPISVSSLTGTASTSFTLSPTINNSQSVSYDYSGPYANPCCPSAWGPNWSMGKVSLDRSSGFVVTELTVSNGDPWASRTVNMSALLLDGSGKVLGFSPIHNVTAAGWITHLWNPVTVEHNTWSDTVNPTIAAQTRSVQLVMVRDHASELASTITTAVAVGQTVVTVVKTLAVFV